jgi:hypothetical protein
MDDDGLGVGEALGKDAAEEQVLGGACTALLAQHPLHRAVNRAPLGDRADGLHQVDQRGVGSDPRPTDDAG